MAGAKNQQPKWFTMTPKQVAKELGVDPARGRSKTESQSRLQIYGQRRLAEFRVAIQGLHADRTERALTKIPFDAGKQIGNTRLHHSYFITKEKKK